MKDVILSELQSTLNKLAESSWEKQHGIQHHRHQFIEYEVRVLIDLCDKLGISCKGMCSNSLGCYCSVDFIKSKKYFHK